MTKPARFQISVAFLLIFSYAVAYGQDVIQSREKLTVFDAIGSRIGVVLDAEFISEPVIALEVNKLVLILKVGRNRFYGREAVLAFDSPDCRGTPYLEDWNAPAGLIPRNVVWNNRVFVLQPDQETRQVTVQSVVFVEPDSAVCQNTFRAYDQSLIPARQLIDLNRHYVPPFVLK